MCASLSLNAPLQVLLSDTPAHAHSSNIRYEMVDNSKQKNKITGIIAEKKLKFLVGAELISCFGRRSHRSKVTAFISLYIYDPTFKT